jgi:hypothetical protein
MAEWFGDHRVVLGWLFGLSLVMFVATLVAIPILVVRMAPDYFVRCSPGEETWRGRHPVVRMTLLVLKNSLGGLFVAAGVAMLFLPGQGVLTIFIGLTLLNFPRKRQLELWIVRQPAVIWVINRMRTKAGRPPLEIPPRPAPPHSPPDSPRE